MTSSSELRAASVGPAAAPALSPGVTLRVHGVFTATLSLRADETGDFVSLAGPRGAILPHAVALQGPGAFPDFSDDSPFGLAVGAPVPLAGGALVLPALAGAVRVDLSSARRLPALPLPAIPRPGPAPAQAACLRRLEELQAAAGTDLRLAALLGAAAPPTPLGASLAGAARALALAGEDLGEVARSVAALIGLGPGLTPAGDDFLSGFLAAARASGRAGQDDAVAQAIEAGSARTADLSAFLLRCAVRGLWPAPLVALAGALSAGREDDAVRAVEALCELGHSSGADLATGFLLGLGGVS